MDKHKEIIKEICDEKQIAYDELSEGFIISLKKDDKQKYIYNVTFPINDVSAASILNDKYATYKLLESKDVSTVEYSLLLNPNDVRYKMSNTNVEKSVKEFFNNHNGYVVIKPKDGSSGKDVYRSNSIGETLGIVSKLFNSYNQICLNPYYDVVAEYRTFFLDGESIFTYKKSKATVTGDGRSTIDELLKEKRILLNDEDKMDIDYKEVLTNGVSKEVTWKFNLSLGANVSNVENEDMKQKIIKLNDEAYRTLGFRFATIDVILTRNNELKILEINNSVCATKFIERYESGRAIIKGIYSRAIDIMDNF